MLNLPPSASAALSVLLFCACTPLQAQDREDQEHLESLVRRLEAVARQLKSLDSEEYRFGSDVTRAEDRHFALEEHLRLSEFSPWRDLAWQFMGPSNISGRVTDVAATTPRGKSYTLYAGTASGGLWKSTNEGTSWESIFEQAPTQSIGDLALAPSDQNVVWIGTGEANIFRSSNSGVGLWRSLDAGESWECRGLGDTGTIARIVVHPKDPERVWVAASGHEWVDGPERGVYRTQDGGESWERVLYVNERTGAIDLVIDPENPDRLYAATWERRRELWNDPRNDRHTRGSGIWRTENGGDAWIEINAGLPEPRYRGRIGIDLARSNPKVLYAFIDDYREVDASTEQDSYGRRRESAIRGATIWRSEDRGDHWERRSENDEFMQRASATYGWVFGQLRVDPVNEDKIYMMGLALNVSEDGGQSFERLRGMHGDHHALWIDPDNPDYLVNGNDGGINVSYDGGKNWRLFTDELPLAQFYNVALDMGEPFHVYGSIQDHGSYRAEVRLTEERRLRRPLEFERAPGGEASYHAIDPTDPNVVYSEGFYGDIRRTELEEWQRSRLIPELHDEEAELRGQWLAPFVLSPHNPRILYHGLNRLYRSLDRGERFEPISPDLSWNDDDKRGDIPYQTISALAESPLRFGLIYAGTDDGRLHVTRDGGADWEEIGFELAADRWISRVVASAHVEDRVYVAQNGKRQEDHTAYLWRSEDRGQSWRSMASGLPGSAINVVREDPIDPRTLYVGNDLGVYVSRDRGRSWDVLGGEMPITYVHDLASHAREDLLVAATHGRGLWMLDLQALRVDPEAEQAAQETVEEDEEEEEPEAASEGTRETGEDQGEEESETSDTEDEVG